METLTMPPGFFSHGPDLFSLDHNLTGIPEELQFMEDTLEENARAMSNVPVPNVGHMFLDHVDMSPAIDSSNTQTQSSFFTGGTIVASDWYAPPAGSTVASHHQYNQSTARAAVESMSGGSSRSPAATSQILTPASTLLEYNASVSDSTHMEDYNTDDDFSPTSDRDYVFVSHSGSQSSANPSGPQFSHMSGYQSSQGSGASDGQRMSRASSVAPSNNFTGAQWGSMYAPGTSFTGHQQACQGQRDTSGYYMTSTYPSSTHTFTSPEQNYGDVVIPDLSTDTHMLDAQIPFRPSHGQQMIGQQHIYGGSSTSTPNYDQAQFRTFGQAQYAAFRQSQHDPRFEQQHGMRHAPGGTFAPLLSIPSTEALLVQPRNDPLTAPMKMEQMRATPSPMQSAPKVVRRSVPTIPSQRSSPYPQPPTRNPAANSSALQIHAQSSVGRSARQQPAVVNAVNRPIQSAKAKPAAYSNPPRASTAEQGRKGGRRKGAPLAKDAKAQSHIMRQAVACWRCALQRDPCDVGTPCNRCLMRFRKGQPYYIECDRSKLPDLVHDFLPAQATMTLMHQKQTIEDTVVDQVLHWDKERPIGVYLTSGYGPPLRWTLHEFKPRTDDLLGQFQYLQDPATGQQRRFHKYSPPFGLLKLDNSDDDYLNGYLEKLLTEEWLWDLGWTCFEEESQIDEEHFQARLVDLICTLFLRSPDQVLKKLLEDILRMLIITYIMGHTLTIVEETLPAVLDAIRYSVKGPNQQFTSPRLANRQLKFYFAIFRTEIYTKILRWQQQTFHTSGAKEKTWYLSFCATLGFAMVLEEVQRTILIQADAKTVKNEMTWEQANTEASNACGRIDDRFKLLVGVFQCKYRDKKWGENGSFGPSTPRYSDPVLHEFFTEVRALVERKSEHLQSRRDVQFGMENQCQYTSRLVARFLLPFLDPPRN